MKHLVIIGLVIPESKSTAAGFRMMQLIDLFKNFGYKISFLSAASSSDYSENIAYSQIQLNDESFNDQIKKLSPDVVMFDRFVTEEQFGWRVAETCPKALRILDTEDLHFLREARRLAFTQNRKLENTDLINPVFRREMASILRCDLSLIISNFEYQLLTEKFRIDEDLLFYIPFLVDKISKESKKYSERKNFMHIGNFLHDPNWQSVLQLKKIWPEIRKKLPKTEFHIYGTYLPPKALQLHNEKEGFIIKGRAASSEKVFDDYRILLAPIPYGAGLKGKLFEAMKYGLPSITTSIGAEGLTSNTTWNGFVEDDMQKLVDRAIDLYNDEKTWNSCQQKGFEILEVQFKISNFHDRFKMKINDLVENLAQHRTQNFLGQILQHQSLQSTKYMSKWIEEKSKNKN